MERGNQVTHHVIHRLGLNSSPDLKSSQFVWTHSVSHQGHDLSCWKLIADWKNLFCKQENMTWKEPNMKSFNAWVAFAQMAVNKKIFSG